MRNKGAELASLCTGAFLLAETGLLDQKRCSTHWAYYEVFRAKYPTIDLIDGSVISDEAGIYSSGGANSLWNLLLYILEKYTDRDTAILAAKFFAIEIDRFDQSMFTIFNGQKNHNDTEILKAQEELESRFSERIVVNDLLESIAINRRTFERRFKNATNNTILEYLQRVRTEAAKRKFEGGRKNVNEVMYEVGYNDVKAFREVFKKFTGMSPVDYRGKYNKKTG
jgi:transcriptional regulator GlxA family with amidase domain